MHTDRQTGRNTSSRFVADEHVIAYGSTAEVGPGGNHQKRIQRLYLPFSHCIMYHGYHQVACYVVTYILVRLIPFLGKS